MNNLIIAKLEDLKKLFLNNTFNSKLFINIILKLIEMNFFIINGIDLKEWIIMILNNSNELNIQECLELIEKYINSIILNPMKINVIHETFIIQLYQKLQYKSISLKHLFYFYYILLYKEKVNKSELEPGKIFEYSDNILPIKQLFTKCLNYDLIYMKLIPLINNQYPYLINPINTIIYDEIQQDLQFINSNDNFDKVLMIKDLIKDLILNIKLGNDEKKSINILKRLNKLEIINAVDETTGEKINPFAAFLADSAANMTAQDISGLRNLG
jgi:hypothetical protein